MRFTATQSHYLQGDGNMSKDEISYDDIDPELQKEFEQAFEQLMNSVQAQCKLFGVHMNLMFHDDKYDKRQRAYLALCGVKVMEELARNIYGEYVAPLPPEVRGIYNKLYPDHIIMMQVEV